MRDERESIADTTVQTMARSWRCKSELSNRIIKVWEIDLNRKSIAAIQIQASSVI